jgi:hypothetical protein
VHLHLRLHDGGGADDQRDQCHHHDAHEGPP